MTTPLHRAVARHDLAALEAALATAPQALELRDARGWTPLMRAAAGGLPTQALLRALLAAGADQHARSDSSFPGGPPDTVLGLAVHAGDPGALAALLEAGLDLHYEHDGYDALLDAVHGRDVFADPELLGLLQLLIAHGVRLDRTTRYAESGLRVLSRLGRFDAVALLLQAGAPETHLQWTPLHRAAALGDGEALEAALAAGAALEARDFWSRTALHVALLAGRIDVAQQLLQAGADPAARARCGQTTLHFALHARDPAVLDFALGAGLPVDDADDFGQTALLEAAELGLAWAVERLAAAGAALHGMPRRETAVSGMPAALADHLAEAPPTSALEQCVDPATIRTLLALGADPQQLSFEGRRALLGLPPEPDETLFECEPAQFAAGRARRFGTRNPERIDEPYWHAMIRSGLTGYAAAQRFEAPRWARDPVWCAQRHGQSLTFLPDGRIVQVAGEHEDSYDPDFCIYNDVFVHHPDGRIEIYGYPEDVFPPTDFHSATLVGDTLWLIGSLGYHGARVERETPVFALDTRSWHIERIRTAGEAPGWIYRHRARLEDDAIVISGGYVHRDGDRDKTPLAGAWRLDLRTRAWARSCSAPEGSGLEPSSPRP